MEENISLLAPPEKEVSEQEDGDGNDEKEDTENETTESKDKDEDIDIPDKTSNDEPNELSKLEGKTIQIKKID